MGNMKLIEKERNEIRQRINDLTWDIKMKESNLITLEKEIKEKKELLNFLKKSKEVSYKNE